MKKKFVAITLFIIILAISGCASNVQTAQPSPTQQQAVKVYFSNKERREETLKFLYSIVTDSRYDPSKQVMAKYMDVIDVEVADVALHFHIANYLDTSEDTVSLAAELIYAGAVVSNAGNAGDWGLRIIDVNYPPTSESCGVSFYVNAVDDLRRIAQAQVGVYNVMKSYVCK